MMTRSLGFPLFAVSFTITASSFESLSKGLSESGNSSIPQTDRLLASKGDIAFSFTQWTPLRLPCERRFAICCAIFPFVSISYCDSSNVTNCALTKVFLIIVSSFTRTPFWVKALGFFMSNFSGAWPFSGMWIGISSQVSVPLGKPLRILRSYQVWICCKKLALISRFGLRDVTNSSDFISDQLNFMIK